MIEGPLLRELGAGAAVSAAAGAVAWVVGRRTGRPQVAAFGRQTAAWAAVDGALAGGGCVAAARRRAGEGDDTARRTMLRRVLWLNAALDVGYVLGGTHLARGPQRRGDGLAIVVQGTFLLWLDTRHARRPAAAVRHATHARRPSR